MSMSLRLALMIALTLTGAFAAGGRVAHAGDFGSGMGNPSWTAGGFVAITPKYEGSKSYEVVGAPFVFPSFGGDPEIVTIHGADDVRLRLFKSQGFVAGVLGGYQFGRKEDDGEKLLGLGDVDGGVVLGAFAGYRLLPWLTFDVSYHRTVSGDVDGGQLRFGLDYEAPVSNRVTLVGRVGATYADNDYMSSYFGVTSAQSLTSVALLPTYSASSGIKDVYLELGARVAFDDKWGLRFGGRYGRLVGDAGDSPVIETADQFAGFALLTYKFGTLR